MRHCLGGLSGKQIRYSSAVLQLQKSTADKAEASSKVSTNKIIKHFEDLGCSLDFLLDTKGNCSTVNGMCLKFSKISARDLNGSVLVPEKTNPKYHQNSMDHSRQFILTVG